MPAPVQQGVGAFQSGVNALTVPWPAHQIGDVAFLMVATANEAITLTTPSGFVQNTNSPQSIGTPNTAGAVRLGLYWCRADSATMADVEVADSGDHQVAQIVTFRGCITSGDPRDSGEGLIGSGGTTLIFDQPVTTTVPNCLVVAFVAIDNDVASSANLSNWACASLTSMVEHLDQSVSTGEGSGLGCASGVKVSAGAVGNITVDNTESVPYAMLVVALAPVPDVSPILIMRRKR